MKRHAIVVAAVAGALALGGCSGADKQDQQASPTETVTVTESAPQGTQGADRAGGQTAGPAQSGDAALAAAAPKSGRMAAGKATVGGNGVEGLVAQAHSGGGTQVYDASGWKSVSGKLAVPDAYPSPVHVKLISQGTHREFHLRSGQAPVAFDVPVTGRVFKIVYNVEGKPAQAPALIVIDANITR